ncbi:DNA mismatch repair endonuclease MutL [Enterobacteriaceae endosymbiont of Plateumaris rustica]|uniref:DNA mismatch repair endonuclease MutL n=1 Tax=Enterobacteriaceae endosymbiont of Plateumaris rustica TaxID=2675796 RepID=UPI0014496129|nr:DNA mismatch repair endonuclease MutL [Enterobacteriaceae endosymbiont of Plateumaris rustica]QJC29034.1 DNA mismatch repair endonuclease MutL [Enterobacteriaceae endosymbiont of Plateumaris rustica]
MSIKILPKEIIKQIAAGEVIDRPSAVVKELIENSIDALSSQINIYIEKGGIKSIKINDNGIGMSKNDLLLCLKKYATSKIKNLNDLEYFKSFGFRGEALTSIKNISRIKIISKTIYQKTAWEIYTEGMDNNIIYIRPSPNTMGTTIEVLDLFYNIPARRKFISNNKIEFIHIKNIIKSVILMKLNIGIKFIYNNKIIYNFPKVESNISYIKRIKSICGQDFIKQSLEINSNYHKMNLFGWITIPNNKYSINIKKYFYINNRIINNKFINRIIKEICKIKFGFYYHQSFLIYLEIESNKIDINIHPQKKDVNFFQLELIYNFFHKSILNYSSIHKNKNSIFTINKEKNNFNRENKFIINKNIDTYNNILFNKIKKKKLVLLKNIPVFHFKNFGILRTILKNNWIIVEKNNILFYLSVKEIEFLLLKIKYKFYLKNQNNIEIIFLNLKIKLIEKELEIFYKLRKILQTLGFNFIINNYNKYKLQLISIPSLLSNFDIQLFFINLFKYFLIKNDISLKKILKWIIIYIINIPKLWDYFKIIDLLMEFELFIFEKNTIIITKLFYPISFSKYII